VTRWRLRASAAWACGSDYFHDFWRALFSCEGVLQNLNNHIVENTLSVQCLPTHGPTDMTRDNLDCWETNHPLTFGEPSKSNTKCGLNIPWVHSIPCAS